MSNPQSKADQSESQSNRQDGNSNSIDDSDSDPTSSPDLSSPTTIRQMVLNYLIHHCYIETATAFANDGIHLNPQQTLPLPSLSTSTSSSKTAPKPSSSPSTLQAPSLSRSDSNRQTEMEVDNLLSLNPTPSHPSHSTHNQHASSSNHRIGELSSQEIQNVKNRRDVRDHILNGRIRQAIDLLNSHFPLVLNGSLSSNSHSRPPNQSSKSHSALSGGSNGASTSGTGTDSNEKKPQDQTHRTLPANPTSLEPSHLFLNLQIQAFIESVRNASTSRSNGGGGGGPSGSSTMNGNLTSNGHVGSSSNGNTTTNGSGTLPSPLPSLAAQTPGISSQYPLNGSRSSSPAPSSAASSTGSTTSMSHTGNSLNPNVFSSLSLAQSLFSNVQKLPSYWRAMYLKELENVTALLAYTDLEKSPVRKYLDQTRRVALAEQINSAIMYRSGRPSQPLIESAVRQNTFIWSQLHSEKISVPNGHPVLNELPVGSTVNDSKKGGKILPSWDLKSFLAER